MDQHVYRIGQLAEKTAVSERTLRYYDHIGLLSPSYMSESGYRLYSDKDLLRLQQILALKFLGFTLEEIFVCIQSEAHELTEILAQQKAMLQEKRGQLDTIIRAIEHIERLVWEGQLSWDSFISMIRVIQMGQNDSIPRKHLTPEQQQKYEEITSRVYPSEVMQKVKQLYPKEWTQEDQRKVDEKYAFIKQELGRLVALGADPASSEAQTVARLSEELNFAQGDPDIEASVNQWWEEFYKLPEEGRPFDTAMYIYTEQEHNLLKQAKTIFQQSQPKNGNT